MPLALFALTVAAYAIGTAEFATVGLLPTVAQDLGITLPLAGLITVPWLQLYVVQIARRYRPGAVDVASALNIAAFNLGIALSAWIGGEVVGSPRRRWARCWWPPRWA
ncbi:MFS transporter [Teichococcus wenyumeiae]|uniref:MFS transporter n=1 Tax=Teichococcus wenyumeiae TaxID=2478470 RepID=UPI0018F4EDFC|nr:MFS transporter [Pseudoroseomonas wenyumeiae]